MQTAITDPSRTYLLISGGDGYATEVVTGDKLADAYLALHFGSPRDCTEDQRSDFLESLLDEDRWMSCYPLGPTNYHEDLEDGHISVILMTEPGELRAKAVRWDAIETLMILGDVELKQAEDGGYSISLDPVENIVSQCWAGNDPAQVIDKVAVQLAAAPAA